MSVEEPKSSTNVNIRIRASTNGLGGPMTAPEVPEILHGIFDTVDGLGVELGETNYRGFYIYNNSPTYPLKNVVLFIPKNTQYSGDDIAVGFDPAAVNTDMQSIGNEFTEPIGVSWNSGNTRTAGIILNVEIPPGGRKGVWVRRKVVPGSGSVEANHAKIRIQIANLDAQVPLVFGVAFMGDTGCNERSKANFRNIESRNPELMVTLGNNSMSNSADCWFAMTEPFRTRLVSTLGVFDYGLNYPTDGDGDNQALANSYYNYFGHKGFFTRIVHNVGILVWNSAIQRDRHGSGGPLNGTEDPEIIEAVRNNLKELKANPDVDWVIVATSRFSYATNDIYDSVDEDNVLLARKGSRNGKTIYHQLYMDEGVDLVVEGHRLAYERLHVITPNSENRGQPNVVAEYESQAPNYTITGDRWSNGMLYLVIGTGGYALVEYDPDQKWLWSAKRDAEHYGYLWLEFSKQQNTNILKGRMYDLQDQSYDSFSITKSPI